MNRREFERLAPEMRRRAIEVARAMRVPADEAEDVAQDAMIKLWMVHDDILDRRSVMALMTVVARRLMIDRYRRRQTTEELPYTMPDEIHPSPLEAIIDDERLRALEAKIEALPKTEHAIIMLRQSEWMDNTEIARLLGISPDSVRTLLSRSRRKLLKQLTTNT